MDTRTEFNVLSLCSGGGMLDVGLSAALDWRTKTVCYVEREASAAATLVARMADQALDPAPVWDDLQTFDGTAWRGKVDIITSGYPCPPFSTAGKRLGKDDPRHLWPRIAELIEEIKPGICFFENVAGHLSLGFEQVRKDLGDLGFNVTPGLFTASEIGASHKRERLFILAVRRCREPGRTQYEPRPSRSSPDIENGGRTVDHASSTRSDKGGCQTGGALRDETRGQESERRECGMADSECVKRGLSESKGRNDVAEITGGRQGLAHGEQSGLEIGARQPGDAGQEQSAVERDSKGVANSCGISRHGSDVRETGQGPDGTEQRQDIDGESLGGLRGRPALGLFAPGPNDPRWPEILQHYPEVEPAIECDFRKLADGLAQGLAQSDQLRLTGNGVVPLQAAYAFITLAAIATGDLK